MTLKRESIPIIEPREVDHYDELSVIRDRFFGLACAINGVDIANQDEKRGLRQLARDFSDSFNRLCEAFARERGVQSLEQ